MSIAQRGNDKAEQQKNRPILTQHCCSGADPGQHRPTGPARFQRAQEPPRRHRPERNDHAVGVEPQRVKIIKRHQRQQHDADDALVRRKITPDDPPSDPQSRRSQHHREQIISPHLEIRRTNPHQPRAQRRMFRCAQRHLPRPGHHLAHVEVKILAALGQDAVERPHGGIAGEQQRHGALAARLIDQSVEQTLQGMACRSVGFGQGHELGGLRIPIHPGDR